MRDVGMRPIEEIRFLGGHVALDFVNTAEGRGEPDSGDALQQPEHLRTWGQRQGILSAASTLRGGADGQELRRALEAREVLYRVFSAQAQGQPPPPADLRELAALTAAAHRAGKLVSAASGQIEWRWSPDELSSVRHVAAHTATELLSQLPPGRLKQCPGERCGWLFLDATKRGNRRWCSMDECGQEAKVARRRQRQATGYL